MKNSETPAADLHGMYRDILYDGSGRVVWDRGWKSERHRGRLP